MARLTKEDTGTGDFNGDGKTDILRRNYSTGQNAVWFMDGTTYLGYVYLPTPNEGDQHCSYSRLSTAPSGENEIIMFKSCFPNSALQGNPTDPAPSINSNPPKGESSGSEYHTVANAKGIYIDILEYFRTRTDKLFIVIAAPPLRQADTTTNEASNARAFNNWLVNEWLAGYPHKNVVVFDFYNVLTSNGGNVNTNNAGWENGNHHRWWNGAIQHIQTVNYNMAAYPSGDSHPSQAEKWMGRMFHKFAMNLQTITPFYPSWVLANNKLLTKKWINVSYQNNYSVC